MPKRAETTSSLSIQYVSCERLQPAPYNPRLMPAGELEKLTRSIESFGFVEPVVARKQDHSVIGGHQRLEAAKALGIKTVPVVYVDVTESQAKALNLALNRIQGEWDMPKLGELLCGASGHPGSGRDALGIRRGRDGRSAGGAGAAAAPSPYEDSFPEAAEALQAQREAAPTRVSKGETWQLGRHRLYCGDSLSTGALERLCDGKKVDVALTDPPYGTAFQSTLAKRGRRKKAIANDGQEEFDDFLTRALPAIKSVMKRGSVLYWFAGGGGAEPVLAKALLAISEHFTLQNTLIWDKVDPGLGWRWRRSWEAIIEASHGKPRVWHGGTNARNVLRYAKAIPQSDDHPTPKPVPLLEEIIRAAAPSRGLVLDPFAGSGPTLIAAERTNRACFAVELEPRYCDIILARWEALTESRASAMQA